MSPQEEIKWYPMRVTYNRVEKIKKLLDEKKIENFLPMCHKKEQEGGDNNAGKLTPAFRNLIFIHSSMSVIISLKHGWEEFEPLRFMVRKSVISGLNSVIYINDEDMDNFLRVATITDEDSVFFLEDSDFLRKPGKRVRVTEGDFADVEGVIKRIKGNKRVVVQLEGVASVAIAFVPSKFLESIDN